MKKATCGLVKIAVFCMLILSLAACSSVTVRPEGGVKDHSEPSYLDSKSFFLLGLIGEHDVDVNEVCEGAAVTQMQTVVTGTDWIFGVFTFGIYTPRTVKVWCEEEPL
jgi:hypothetical protein